MLRQTRNLLATSILLALAGCTGVFIGFESLSDANIDTVNIEERDGLNTAMDFTIEVRDRVHLAHILRRLRAAENVIRISRMKG